VNRWQYRADVDLADHPDDPQKRAGADGHPLKAREHLPCLW
jgi:hypothetical protein